MCALRCAVLRLTQLTAHRLHSRLINKIKPDTIVETKIIAAPRNYYETLENLNVAIAGARAMGCRIINIGAADLHEGKARSSGRSSIRPTPAQPHSCVRGSAPARV